MRNSPCAVYECGVVDIGAYRLEPALQHDHVVHGVQSGDDVDPERIIQSDRLDDEEVRNKSAREKHRKNIDPIEHAAELEIGTAHRIGDNGSKDECACRSEHRARDRDAVARPEVFVLQHDLIIFKGEDAGQEPDTADRIIGALIETARQNIDNGIDTQDAKESDDDGKHHVKGAHAGIELALGKTLKPKFASCAVDINIKSDRRRGNGEQSAEDIEQHVQRLIGVFRAAVDLHIGKIGEHENAEKNGADRNKDRAFEAVIGIAVKICETLHHISRSPFRLLFCRPSCPKRARRAK